MPKTAVIHQPDFLSYAGFFHRFLHADLYIALDDVQFARNTSKSWQNRDKIKTPAGDKWLTVPVQKTSLDIKIDQVLLSTTTDWRSDHLHMITENYRKAPHFAEIFPHLEKLYAFQCDKMIDFNMKSILLLTELFGIKIEMRKASEWNPKGKSNELLVDILTKAGCQTYLSGIGAKDYFDPAPFADAGIQVQWQEFTHPIYPQLHGAFIPNLSAIDILLNCGIEESRRLLRSA